jgi:hypothetical protein
MKGIQTYSWRTEMSFQDTCKRRVLTKSPLMRAK